MTLHRVCVLAGSDPGASPAYTRAAHRLGTLLAHRDTRLVYSGTAHGLAGHVADAALAAGGRATAVVPQSLRTRETLHPGLRDLRTVATHHERKTALAELADAFIALPGGLDTLDHVAEAASWTQAGLHAKPVGLLNVDDYWGDLSRLLDHFTRQGLIRTRHRAIVVSAGDPRTLLDRLDAWDPHSPADPPPPRGPLLGTSTVVLRNGRVLLGRRKGSHGAGTWSFPGGKVDPAESPEAAAARELHEETGMRALRLTPIGWTSDVFAPEGLHYITLHHLAHAEGEPRVVEPDKTETWSWHPWEDLPEPLFAPVASLSATGWHPETRTQAVRNHP